MINLPGLFLINRWHWKQRSVQNKEGYINIRGDKSLLTNLITWFRTNLYFFVILSWFNSLICVCTYRSFLILLVQLSNTWHLCIHQYTAGFNYINMLISVAVNHCVASPLDIGILEAGVKTNAYTLKSKKYIFPVQ
jgi:hypothetical protein